MEIGGCRDYVWPMAQLEAWKYRKEKGQDEMDKDSNGCTASSWQRNDAWSGRRREALDDSD